MSQNLTNDERSQLGAANLDAFFSHLDFIVDNPEAVATIPDGSTVVYQNAGDSWVNAQNDNLAAQAIANGENVHRVTIPGRFSLTFPDGRNVSFRTDSLWTRHEVSQLTGLTIAQIRILEKERVLEVSSENLNNREHPLFNFSQVIQLQAYALILGNQPKQRGFGSNSKQAADLKIAELKPLLEFYDSYNIKLDMLQVSPVLFDGKIFSVAPDMSGSQELLSAISSLNWKSESTRTARVFPPLLDVFIQLCENALRLTKSQVWTQSEMEQRLMLAA